MRDGSTEFPAPFTRRKLLSVALAGAGALQIGRASGLAPSDARAPFRIDVHHHLSPPKWIEELSKVKLGNRPAYDWTPERSIDDMDRAGIAVSMTSITTPATSFLAKDTARVIARECNDYAARLRDDYKGRFGIFVSLPLPDVDGALAEIAYGFDILKADGVAMLTSYGDRWLGSNQFAPVFDELNRRKAIVHTHPTSADCCRNLMPQLPDQLIEWGTDTTRAIADIVVSGAARRYRDIKFIFSHAGGTMPFLAERLINAARLAPTAAQKEALNASAPNGFEAEIKRFFYDTAQATHPAPLSALLRLIPVSQIVFGTDFPYRSGVEGVEGLAAYGISTADIMAIERGNALNLMPQWA